MDVRTAEVIIGGKIYIRPVAHLILLNAIDGNTKNN